MIMGAMRRAGLVGVALSIATGCASTSPSTEAPTASRPFAEPLPARQIEETLAARPTLPAAAKVAYFVTDPSLAPEIEALLSSSPRVMATHRIPSVLVTGHREIDADVAPAPRQPIDNERLRRLAASAGADAVLIADYAARERYEPNGLASLSVLVVPVLFVPLQDASSESSLAVMLFDTRTGRELGHVHAMRRGTDDFVMLYSNAAEKLRLRHRRELLAEAEATLSELLAAIPTPAASPTEAVALPSDTTDPWAEPRHVRVGLVADGTVTIEGQRLDSLASFVGRLRDHAERGPTVATLFAASSVSYARVREVLELMRRIGIRDVRIEVAPEHAPSGPETKEADRDEADGAAGAERHGDPLGI